MEIAIICLVVVLIVALVKWFLCWISLIAYIGYFEKKKIPQPTESELKELQRWAAENTIRDFFKLNPYPFGRK